MLSFEFYYVKIAFQSVHFCDPEVTLLNSWVGDDHLKIDLMFTFRVDLKLHEPVKWSCINLKMSGSILNQVILSFMNPALGRVHETF